MSLQAATTVITSDGWLVSCRMIQQCSMHSMIVATTHRGLLLTIEASGGVFLIAVQHA